MKGEISKFVGNKIKYFRKIKGLTQKELGAIVGVKHNTISSYENGTNEAEHDILHSLANVLGVSIDNLFPPTTNNLIVVEDKVEYATNKKSYDLYPDPVAAGTLSFIDGVTKDDVESIELPNVIMGKHAGSKDIYFIKVNGDSMNKVFPHESLIAVKNIDIHSLQDDDIVVYSDEYEYSVKTFYHDKVNGRYRFSPQSTDRRFYEQSYSYEEAKDLKIHGKVVLYVVSTD